MKLDSTPKNEESVRELLQGSLDRRYAIPISGATLRRCFTALILFPLTTGAAWAAPAEKHTTEASWVSDSQDLDLLAKAWRTSVHLDYQGKELGFVINDLSKRTGIQIRCLADTSKYQGRGGYSSGNSFYPGNIPFRLASRFLGATQAYRLSLVKMEASGGPGRVGKMASSGKVPLAVALKWLADTQGMLVSYRKGTVVLDVPRKLLRELLISRDFAMRHLSPDLLEEPGGAPDTRAIYLCDVLESVVEDVPELYADEDVATVTRLLEAACDEKNSLKALERFAKLDLGICVTLKKNPSRIEIITHPESMWRFSKYRWKALNRPSKAFARNDAARFRKRRLTELSSAAWRSLDESEKKKVGAKVEQLCSETYQIRTDATKTLHTLGLPAAAVLLRRPAGTEDAEYPSRANAVLTRIYAEAERKAVFKVASEYLGAAKQGDVRACIEKFWTPERRQGYRRRAESFRRSWAHVGSDAALAPLVLKQFELPGDLKGKLSYKAGLGQQMKRPSVSIEIIRLEGKRAEVSYGIPMSKDWHRRAKARLQSRNREIPIPMPKGKKLFDGIQPLVMGHFSMVFRDGNWRVDEPLWEIDRALCIYWSSVNGFEELSISFLDDGHITKRGKRIGHRQTFVGSYGY